MRSTSRTLIALPPDNPAVLDDDHLGTIIFELGQNVRRHNQRHARIAKRKQQRGKIAPRLRIEAGGGLVQQQHLGLVHDRLPDGEALAQPARKLARAAFQPIEQADIARGFFDGGGASAAAMPCARAA